MTMFDREKLSPEGKAGLAIFEECIAAKRAGTATREQNRFINQVFNVAVAALGGNFGVISEEDLADGEAYLEWEANELRRMCSNTPTHAVHTTMPEPRHPRARRRDS
jgi:hypothetical protein